MIPVSKYIIYVLPASRDQIPLMLVFFFSFGLFDVNCFASKICILWWGLETNLQSNSNTEKLRKANLNKVLANRILPWNCQIENKL